MAEITFPDDHPYYPGKTLTVPDDATQEQIDEVIKSLSQPHELDTTNHQQPTPTLSSALGYEPQQATTRPQGQKITPSMFSTNIGPTYSEVNDPELLAHAHEPSAQEERDALKALGGAIATSVPIMRGTNAASSAIVNALRNPVRGMAKSPVLKRMTENPEGPTSSVKYLTPQKNAIINALGQGAKDAGHWALGGGVWKLLGWH